MFSVFSNNKFNPNTPTEGFAQLRLRFNENMLDFAQIRRNSNGFCSNRSRFGVFLLRSREFCTNLMIWFFFSQIYLVLHKSNKDPTKNTDRRPKGTSWSIFIRSGRWSIQSDLTWPVGFCDRWRVFSSKTRCHWVSCGLGTNPTWTNLWTPLTSNITC